MFDYSLYCLKTINKYFFCFARFPRLSLNRLVISVSPERGIILVKYKPKT